MTRVCLISPNDIYREGLGRILESNGFKVADSLRVVSDLEGDELDPDLIYLVDSIKPEEQARTVQQIIDQDSSLKVIVLAETFEVQPMIDCFAAGAQGYIIKSNDSLPLTASLQLVAAGQRVLPSETVELLNNFSGAQHLAVDGGQDLDDAKLSPRELDVLCCLMAGYANKVIARKLDVCEATVKVHVKAILRKLNVRNRTQAAIWANSRGLGELQAPTEYGTEGSRLPL